MSLDYIENKIIYAIYIIPHNRRFNPEYIKAIEYALNEVQRWYASQLNELTFKLSHPIVKTLYSTREEYWFIQSPHHDERNAGYYNSLKECDFAYPNIRDQHNKFVMFLDGGTDGGGLKEACILVRHDLNGLVMEMSTLSPGKSVGGVAHELGHPFNLDDHKEGGVDG